MARGKKNQPEQVVNLLRQIEVATANGKSTDKPAQSEDVSFSQYGHLGAAVGWPRMPAGGFISR